jgi:hypothetical protein
MKPSYGALRILQKVAAAHLVLEIQFGGSDVCIGWPGLRIPISEEGLAEDPLSSDGQPVSDNELDKLIRELHAHEAEIVELMAPDGTAFYKADDIEKLVEFWAENALAPWWSEFTSK